MNIGTTIIRITTTICTIMDTNTTDIMAITITKESGEIKTSSMSTRSRNPSHKS